LVGDSKDDPFVRELTGFESVGGDLAYNNFHSCCFEIVLSHLPLVCRKSESSSPFPGLLLESFQWQLLFCHFLPVGRKPSTFTFFLVKQQFPLQH
jgi:hypothetical protein